VWFYSQPPDKIRRLFSVCARGANPNPEKGIQRPGDAPASSKLFYPLLKLELVSEILLDDGKAGPQGLKPSLYAVSAARLKPCPSRNRFWNQFLRP
jgi:hypothetical protein